MTFSTQKSIVRITVSARLAAGPRRFVELQRVLPGISTEQLRSRLNRMVALAGF